MISALLAHLIAGVLAACSGLCAVGWALVQYKENPYADFVMAVGRITAWAAIAYLALGIALYGMALRRRGAPDPRGTPSPQPLGWIMQLVGATFALASSAFQVSGILRGPMGDSKGLANILLGLAVIHLIGGILLQVRLRLQGRRPAQSP